MKFYNPFKPHIAEFFVDGQKKFVYRIMILCWWEYLDNTGSVYWWTSKSCHDRFTFDSIEELKNKINPVESRAKPYVDGKRVTD